MVKKHSSSYSTLVGLLQKDSKHQKSTKRRKLDQRQVITHEQEQEKSEKSGGLREIFVEQEIIEDKGIKEEENKDSEDEDEHQDELEKHFGDSMSTNMKDRISVVQNKNWSISNYEDSVLKLVSKYSAIVTLDSKGKGETSKISADVHFSKIKKKLHEPWGKFQINGEPFTDLQLSLISHFLQYHDILYTNRNIENAYEIRQIYALHAMNHVLKIRNRVLKNNGKLARAETVKKEIGELRDQGFTRPKVLILVPFKNSVVDIVKILIHLSATQQQENRKRFFEEFDIKPTEETINPNKPADFLATFRGNIDDAFRIGIKFTRKTMKFYANFYSADIIIASPLGLRLIIGAEGDKKRDFDFLSSIEVLILDQCDTFLMQNWDHVEYIFDHINLIPKDAHDCDFARIKNWYLDGSAKYFRQTLIFSDYLTPEMNSLYNKYLLNIDGKLKIKQLYQGAILNVIPLVQQIFTRLDSPTLLEADDIRFKHFIEKTLPALRKSTMINQNHTMIFIPSYFDFVRVRNYFEDTAYSYSAICEYTSAPEVTRARAHFLNGKRDFLIYTERLHFFRRYRIRGVQHIVFYALPDNPQFYPELLNLITPSMDEDLSALGTNQTPVINRSSCHVLFSKYDHLKLERIVGSTQLQRMLYGSKSITIFS
ncbi:hypothetical protein G9A89_022982 [Geosiphon pyriformis]|nr:hypothetical protein G9A89_022982 [Geosiphon pyriformis]